MSDRDEMIEWVERRIEEDIERFSDAAPLNLHEIAAHIVDTCSDGPRLVGRVVEVDTTEQRITFEMSLDVKVVDIEMTLDGEVEG